MKARGQLGAFLAIACAVMVGCNVVLSKVALASVPSVTALFYIVSFSLLLSYGVGFQQRAPIPRRLQDPGVALTLIHGVLASLGMLFTFFGLYHLAAPTVTFVARVEVLISTACAFVFLKESFSHFRIVGFLLGLTGTVIICLPDNLTQMAYSEQQTGIGYVLLGAAAFGTCELFGKLAVKSIPVTSFMMLRNTVTFLVLTGFAISQGAIAWVEPGEILCLFGAALTGPIMARMLFMYGIRLIPLSYAVALNQTQPLFVALMAAMLALELPTSQQWFGGSTILIGTVLLVIQPRRHGESSLALRKSAQ